MSIGVLSAIYLDKLDESEMCLQMTFLASYSITNNKSHP